MRLTVYNKAYEVPYPLALALPSLSVLASVSFPIIYVVAA